MSNEELAVRIQAGEDTDGKLMLQLWEQNRRFLAMMAKKYKYAAEFEDLMQEGYLGLCAAVEHWNSDKGTTFISYAAFWIRQAMIRYTEYNSPMSCNMHEKVSKYRRFVSWFEQTYGRAPGAAETCYFLGLDETQLKAITGAIYRSDTASLDSTVGDDESCCLGDLIPSETDVEESVLDEVQQAQLKAVIWPLVDTLPEKQAAVIRMRYQEGLTLKQTGESLGFNLQAAREHERKGFRELRRSHRTRRLRPFLTEAAEAEAYRGNGIESFNRTWTSSTERAALRLYGEQRLYSTKGRKAVQSGRR